jgi:Na+-transporting methylmalonyl-CoA/oxaloacetate decarboxylase gamma subunit
MSVVEYLVNSLLGICVVFFALALLIAIIVIMSKLNLSDEPKKAKGAAAPAAAPAAVPAQAALAPGSAGDLKLYNTDPRDAAMIMAIVADELQKPLNELRFLSIREITPKKD